MERLHKEHCIYLYRVSRVETKRAEGSSLPELLALKRFHLLFKSECKYCSYNELKVCGHDFSFERHHQYKIQYSKPTYTVTLCVRYFG